MITIAERDLMLAECWRCSKHQVPDPDARGPHYPVTVFGVVDDSALHLVGGDGPYVDVVSYWPAARIWTVTHLSRCDSDEAVDFPAMVTYWQPLFQFPWVVAKAAPSRVIRTGQFTEIE